MCSLKDVPQQQRYIRFEHFFHVYILLPVIHLLRMLISYAQQQVAPQQPLRAELIQHNVDLPVSQATTANA